MARILRIAAAMAVALMPVGCVKDDVGNDVTGNKIKVSFTANREEVKSVLNSDKSVSWATNDIIDVYDGTAQNAFTYEGQTTAGTFTGEITAGATDFYAVYPRVIDSRATNSPSKFEKLQTTTGADSVICRTFLQSCQKPVKDSFSPFANLAAGTPTLEGDKLSGGMINLCSYFKFTISSEKINRVIFKSGNNTKLSGLVYVTFANGEITTEGDEVPYVECTCNGVDAIAPGTYYLCVLPGNYGRVEISLSDTDGHIYEIQTKSNLNLTRNQTANFKTIDADLVACKTNKLSLFYNFMTASNLSGYATGSSKTTNVTLTLGGKEYTSEHYYNYARSGYFTWGANGYMNSPAVEGYALDQVILSFRGHNSNCAATMKIYPGDGSTAEEYTGAYKVVKTPKFTGIDSRFAFGTCNARVMYWAHIFTFGKNSTAELASSKIPEWAKSGALPNTSYRVKNSASGPCNIIAAEFIYVPDGWYVPEPEPVIVPVSGINLVESVTLAIDESTQLVPVIMPDNATNKKVIWKSEDESVVTVTDKGIICGVSKGVANVSATTEDGGLKASCKVNVIYMDAKYVDLGLSVKWASCNLGAKNPEEYGDYYAWGEIETKSEYSLSTYKFYKTEKVTDEIGFEIEYNGYTKYIPQFEADSYGFGGFYDNKTVLDPKDDVVRVKLGGKWRMPQRTEIDELINNCQCDWVTYKGVKGRKFTSKKAGYTDKWIFLPAAGYRYSIYHRNVGTYGYYWSSLLYTGGPSRACYVGFDSDAVGRSLNDRYRGLSVRPVYCGPSAINPGGIGRDFNWGN